MDISNAYSPITQKVNLWIKDFVKLIPNIIIAAVVLVIGFLLANFVQKLSSKIFTKVSHNNALNRLFSILMYDLLLALPSFLPLAFYSSIKQ